MTSFGDREIRSFGGVRAIDRKMSLNVGAQSF